MGRVRVQLALWRFERRTRDRRSWGDVWGRLTIEAGMQRSGAALALINQHAGKLNMQRHSVARDLAVALQA